MSSNYEGIQQALIKAVEEVDDTLERDLPNKPLKDKPDSMWLAVHNKRGKSDPATLGNLGEDNHPGFLQIDINVPKNKGAGDAIRKGDEFVSYFTAGKLLTYNTQNVKVISSSMSSGRYVGGYYRISVTVVYYARTQRQ